MRAVIAALLAFCLWAVGPAHGENVGFDFLGIKSPHWDCGAMLAALSSLPQPVPCGAFIDDTFGKSDACLKRLLASRRCSAFRGHLAWSNHRPVPASVLIPRARYLDSLQREFPGVRFSLSHICEHSLSRMGSASLFAALMPVLQSSISLIDSAMGGFPAPGVPLECHGPLRTCAAVSLDGQSAVDVDIERFKANGELYSLIWDRSFNCRFADGDNRPPGARTDCPTQDQFNHLVRLWYPMPPWPPGVPHISSPEIWKPSAENYGGCKGRMCKPVAILNRRWPKIQILAMNGRKLIECPYGGPIGRQSRYYCPLTAFQLGQLAEQTAQSEFVFLDAPGYRTVVNAYRRGGLTR